MSEKKSLLQSLLDELSDIFQKLRDIWENDWEDADKVEIVDLTNSALLILRVLKNSDHGEEAEVVINKMREILKKTEGLEWSAAFAHVSWVIIELEK